MVSTRDFDSLRFGSNPDGASRGTIMNLPTVFVVKLIWADTDWHMYGFKNDTWFLIFDFKDIPAIPTFFEDISKKGPNYYDVCIYRDGHNLKDNFVKIVWDEIKDRWMMSKYIGNHWANIHHFLDCENFNKYFRDISKEKENFYNIRISKIKKH